MVSVELVGGPMCGERVGLQKDTIPFRIRRIDYSSCGVANPSAVPDASMPAILEGLYQYTSVADAMNYTMRWQGWS